MSDDLSIIDPRLLTPQLRVLVRLIGVAETWKLLHTLGGLDFKFAQCPRNASVLNEILSPSSVVVLCAEFGGTRLSLPKKDQLSNQLRDDYIVRSNKSGAVLAREFGLTYRMIKYIKRRRKRTVCVDAEPIKKPQPDLFPLDRPAASFDN